MILLRDSSVLLGTGEPWTIRAIRILTAFAVLALIFGQWPISLSAFEWGKLWLAAVPLTLAMMTWSTHVLLYGLHWWRWHLLDGAVIAWLVITGIAMFLSQAPTTSLVGAIGSSHHALLAVGEYAVIWMLLRWSFPKRSDIRGLAFLLGGTIVAGILLTVALTAIALVRTDGTSVRSMSAFVTSNDLTGLLLGVFGGAVLWASLRSSSMGRQIGAAILTFVAVVGLGMLDVLEGWIAFGSAAVLAMVFVTFRLPRKNLAIGFLAIVIAVLGLLTDTLPGKKTFINDVLLDQSTGWSITGSALSTWPLNGSGPETFLGNFLTLRPVAYNETSFWSVRFVRSSSELTHTLTTTGVLGMIVLFGIFAVALISGVRLFRSGKDTERSWSALALIILIPVLLTGLWRTWSVGVMAVVFLTLPMVVPGYGAFRHAKSVRLHHSVRTIIAIAVLILALGVGAWTINSWRADAALARGDARFAGDLQAAEESYATAVRLRPAWAIGYSRLGEALVQEFAAGTDADATTLQSAIDRSIVMLRTAVERDPIDVAYDEQLIDAYRTYASGTDGTENVLPELYARAMLADPVSPSLPAEAGLYFLSLEQADVSADGQPVSWAEQARALFLHARELKADLPAATYGLAQADETLGDTDAADENYQALVTLLPESPDALYEYGAFLVRQDRTEEAQAVLEDAVVQEPQYANALYLLAGIYLQQGETERARSALTTILEFNPDNGTVQEQLDALSDAST